MHHARKAIVANPWAAPGRRIARFALVQLLQQLIQPVRQGIIYEIGIGLRQLVPYMLTELPLLVRRLVRFYVSPSAHDGFVVLSFCRSLVLALCQP